MLLETAYREITLFLDAFGTKVLAVLFLHSITVNNLSNPTGGEYSFG